MKIINMPYRARNQDQTKGVKTMTRLLPYVLLFSLTAPNCFANDNNDDSYRELMELLENIDIEPGYDEQRHREYETVCKKVSESTSKYKRKVCRNVPVKGNKTL